ncbi:MAG: phospholipid scramblase 1 [Caeruleum heppii]|nr:MAG: phospholipid scramblase 1 [Caeruleum heppii]
MDKVLLTFLVVDLLFLGTGGLLVGVTIATKNEMARGPTLETVASNLLLMSCPLDAAIGNAILVFFTFLVSLPGIALSKTRFWLRVHGWLVVLCALFTLVLGLDIWYQTLKTQSNLSVLWGQQSDPTQSLLQQRFNCCGYLNGATPPFQTDATCPNVLVAAQKLGCVGSFSQFANDHLNLIFTASFGIVALDFILLLCTAMVLKDRGEKQRYQHIDEKTGPNGI